MKPLSVYIFFLFILFSARASGQAANRGVRGEVSGSIKDSSGNLPLNGATVAVYKVSDSALIAYTLSTAKGDFYLSGLPVDRLVRVVVSFIGYRTYSRNIKIDSLSPTLDMGGINLSISNDKLADVVVTAVPPVRMNGDTLEFNADAFKLDPNAQTEDLLRVLPGVTIWADGVITVNGQEVKSLMVNGKPFFGGNIKVATQNIPKDAVEKVQVYQKFKDSTDAMKDSTAEINIRLKKGKDVGYFGKISGGYGTNATYAGDAAVSLFNSRTQLGLALTHNDINKVARDMSHLLANTTFKGSGAETDYQSDFTLPGKNIFTAGGALLQHDFIAQSDNYHVNRLNSEYFFNKNDRTEKDNSQTITHLGGDRLLNQQNTGTQSSNDLSQSAYAQYEKKVDANDLQLTGSFVRADSRSSSRQRTVMTDENASPLSQNEIDFNNRNILDRYMLVAAYTHAATGDKSNRVFSNFSLLLRSDNSSTRQNREQYSNYTSLAATPDTQTLSRNYANTLSHQANWLSFSLPNLTAGLFSSGFLSNLRLSFKNDLRLNTAQELSDVKDKDSITGIYQTNGYLSNKRHETVVDEDPMLTLTSRLSKTLSGEIAAGPRFYSLESSSRNVIQQLSRNYQNLTTSAKLNFYQLKPNHYTNQVYLLVSSNYEYPTIQQLAPLVDSSNLNYIQAGNLKLREQNVRKLEFMLWHNSLKRRNPFGYDITAGAGYTNDFIAFRNKVDSLGRTISSPQNVNGYNFFSLGGQLRKSYKLSAGQIQLSLAPSWSMTRSPMYINDTLYYFHNSAYSIKPTISYEYDPVIIFNYSFRFSKTINKSAGATGLNNKTYQHEISAVLHCTKRLSVVANAVAVDNEFDANDRTAYTILNADIKYRLLKNNTAEIKLSGMDLLNQNSGLNNYSSVNSLTKAETTILRRYFMVSLAWYPRKFGK